MMLAARCMHGGMQALLRRHDYLMHACMQADVSAAADAVSSGPHRVMEWLRGKQK